MIRTIALVALLIATACKREPSAPAPTAGSATGAAAATPAGSAAPSGAAMAAKTDGPRTISVQVNAEGYAPERIVGKPNEKLMLVFTRTVDSTCVAQLKTPNGDVVDLPLNKPVNVAVTVPATGEVGFACGMDMIHGTVVAQPAG